MQLGCKAAPLAIAGGISLWTGLTTYAHLRQHVYRCLFWITGRFSCENPAHMYR